jgi:hypothetical protein
MRSVKVSVKVEVKVGAKVGVDVAVSVGVELGASPAFSGGFPHNENSITTTNPTIGMIQARRILIFPRHMKWIRKFRHENGHN